MKSSFQFLFAVAVAVAISSCGPPPKYPEFDEGKTIPFDPSRPGTPLATTAPLYSGSDPLVVEAQLRYRTGLDLHRKLIMRSCAGTNGVCHNQKEYPDMHTPASFTQTVGAACNVQPGSYTGVFDRCERPGDRFRFDDPQFPEIEIGHIQYILGEDIDYGAADIDPLPISPGLHITLATPIPLDRKELYATGLIVRTFKDVNGFTQQLAFANYRSNWWILEGGKKLFARVQEYQVDEVNTLIKAGVVQGDYNRNGIFGAKASALVSLLNPGKPEESYLVSRLRGQMQGSFVPGSRMPLANQPPSSPDMLALMCFIEQLPASSDQVNLDSHINFENCGYSADAGGLNLVGTGVSWAGRILPLLQANCGGCHGGANPQLAIDFNSPDIYNRLMKPSGQKGSLNLIQPGRPEASYLWLKVSGDGSIVGSQMPLDIVSGTPNKLPDDAMNDLQTWILGGALP